ncbi:MAG: hypothetical protein DI533_02455 [Cereibacter sphaeroides]|uniref:Lipoprotein n=1 Tax=Cereibacter sphaeroides TaxID=1063 RepID=A0A2W5UP01_CERSP|nr:MAG: hypothetical protein DI533_02455 [Cereibacter sphaeroides]
MGRKLLAIAFAVLAACDTSQMAPNSVAVQETPSTRIPNAAASGTVSRWEGESVFYFTRKTAGQGIYSNPFAFDVYLSNLPVSFDMTETGRTWTRIAPEDTPGTNDWNYAFRLQNRPGGNPNNPDDLRNILTVSPARGPMLIDHGRSWTLNITDNGGSQSGQQPVTNTYTFTYVQPGRCTISGLSLSNENPDKNTSVTLTGSAGPYCKRVWVTAREISGGASVGGTAQPNPARDPVDAIYDSTAPGTGKAHAISQSKLVRDNDVVFEVVAIDASGARVSDSKRARVKQPAPSTPQPVAQCPSNPGGFPTSQKICVSCPSGGGTPYESYVIGDYCSAADAIAELTPMYGNCSLSSC